MDSQKDDLLQIFRRGAEFAQELLKENERLRYRIVELERNHPHHENPHPMEDTLLRRLSEVEQEKEEMVQRLKTAEAENISFAVRLQSIENEMNNLANLYISSHQLHSTLNFQEILEILTEIIINLIGAEEFAIMQSDEKTGGWRLLSAEGIKDRDIVGALRDDEIIVMLSSGSVYVSPLPPTSDEGRPLVVIPLTVDGIMVGVIILYRFLSQKKKIEPLDYELFKFLAAHAGTAIMAARLNAESKSYGICAAEGSCRMPDPEVVEHARI